MELEDHQKLLIDELTQKAKLTLTTLFVHLNTDYENLGEVTADFGEEHETSCEQIE